MGSLALVIPAGEPSFGLDPSAASQLADLGVTRVSLLRDAESVAVVLEGWAFDPERSAARTEEIIVGGAGRARVLHELANVTLSAAVPADEGNGSTVAGITVGTDAGAQPGER